MERAFPIGEVSRVTGVPPDTIRAWERRYRLLEPARTPGNRRRYGTADVARIRLMQQYLDERVPAARAAELARGAKVATLKDNPGVPAAYVRQALTVLHDSLEGFDDAPADRLLRRLLAAFPPPIVLRDVVLPYLREVGSRWECGETTVAQEHFASTFLEGWMLTMAHGWSRQGNARAVLACLPGERHALGLIAFGLVVRDLGWQVTYLGADTPLEAVARAADATGARAIVLCAALKTTFAEARPRLAEICERYPVALGGRGIPARAGEKVRAQVLPVDLLEAAAAFSA